MRKSELLAMVLNYKQDLVEVSEEVFFELFHKNANSIDIDDFSPVEGCNCMQFIWDNFEYSYYYASYCVGIEGHMEFDVYFCRRALLTDEEISEIGILLNNIRNEEDPNNHTICLDGE